MGTGRRPGRPTIYEEAMTPTERQRRWRAKAKEAEIRAESSVAPGPRRYHRDDSVKRLGIERRAYITLLAPVSELAMIAETEGKVTELLERMSPDQRVHLGRAARHAIAVVARLADIPDPTV